MRTKPLILVVDDEESFLEIISTKLKAEGFDIVLARDGEDGIKKAESAAPDLILMDINMPGLMGNDAAVALKRNPRTKNLKIAFLTSLKEPWPGFDKYNKEISKNLGMEDFLTKTDDLDTNINKIKSLLKS